MNYFIINNKGQQEGPYTLQQLATLPITAETLVWTKSMKDWTPAWQVDELKCLLSGSVPPPPPPTQGYNSSTATPHMPISGQEPTPSHRSHLLLYILMGGIGLLMVILLFTNPNAEDHRQAIKTEVGGAMEQIANQSTEDDLLSQSFHLLAQLVSTNTAETAIEQLTQYHNSLLFSKMTVNIDGTEHVVSYGMLGHVWTINKDDVVRALNGYTGYRPSNQSEEKSSPSTPSTVVADSITTPILEQKANEAAEKIKDRVTREVDKKLEEKLQQLTDSSTIDRLIDKILSLI